MQYFSSSTIRWRPRAWPSMRLRRVEVVVLAGDVAVLMDHLARVPPEGMDQPWERCGTTPRIWSISSARRCSSVSLAAMIKFVVKLHLTEQILIPAA